MRAFLAVLVIAALARCSGSTAGLPIRTTPVEETCCRAAGDPKIRFEYLGTSGWLIARGDEAVLTAPFFTNPGLLRTGLWRIPAARAVTLRHMQRVDGRDRVRVVLAGHSHYDHLLDVPAVFETLERDAHLYASDAAKNLLDSALRGRITSVSAGAGTDTRPGSWTRVGNVRFMPIRTEHAPQFHGLKFYRGDVATPTASVPRRARGWKEGVPLAYLIDFLRDDGKTFDFRIYVNDAAHGSPFGKPDPVTLAEHGGGVDVAILCAASFDEVKNYPQWIIDELRPKHVLVAHWEDFFIPYDRPERTVRLTNIREFVRHLEKSVDGRFTMLPRHGKIAFVSPIE